MKKLAGLLLSLLVFPSVSADALADRLVDHVQILSESERSVFDPDKLDEAADYIKDQFKKAGYKPKFLPYIAQDRTFKNIQAEKKGNNEIIIISAHYDTFKETLGADDDASGIAVLIELAKLMKKINTTKTIRFVAFSTEEPPFFKTRNMGSLIYAKTAKEADENIVAMLSLEMLGYYSEEKGSQHYPFPYMFFYPSTGNFIGVVSNYRSRALKDQITSSLKKYTKLPVESAWGFGFIPGFDWSDHWSFWKQGYPAVMITDTGPFRNPHYHKKTDTYETLDYKKMADITKGLAKTIGELG